ncbi:MAG: divergent PAP2 family protein [Mycoplasmatales bacterium]
MNEVIIVSLMAIVVAQLLKYPIYYFKQGQRNLGIIFSTGSMPSSHTALVVAMALEVGQLAKFSSPVFGVACIFAIITIHDAVKVRGESGKQAKIINKISIDLKAITEVLNVKLDQEERNVKLKELIGHNTNEVLVGFLVGTIVFLIYNSF